MTPALFVLLSLVLPLASAFLIKQHLRWKREEETEAQRKQKFIDDLAPLESGRREVRR